MTQLRVCAKCGEPVTYSPLLTLFHAAESPLYDSRDHAATLTPPEWVDCDASDLALGGER